MTSDELSVLESNTPFNRDAVSRRRLVRDLDAASVFRAGSGCRVAAALAFPGFWLAGRSVENRRRPTSVAWSCPYLRAPNRFGPLVRVLQSDPFTQGRINILLMLPLKESVAKSEW